MTALHHSNSIIWTHHKRPIA